MFTNELEALGWDAFFADQFEEHEAAGLVRRANRRRTPRRLLAADGQPLAALCTTPFQHQAPVFRAHPHQKTVRALPVPRIGLKRSFPLHEIPFRSNGNPNGNERFPRVSMRAGLCYSRRPFPAAPAS